MAPMRRTPNGKREPKKTSAASDVNVARSVRTSHDPSIASVVHDSGEKMTKRHTTESVKMSRVVSLDVDDDKEVGKLECSRCGDRTHRTRERECPHTRYVEGCLHW